MGTFSVVIEGERGIPLGGWGTVESRQSRAIDPESSYDVEMTHFTHGQLCIEGNEPQVMAPKGRVCFAGHKLKEGQTVLDIGKGAFLCLVHSHYLPTFEELQQRYQQPWFTQVTITKVEKG